MTMRKFSIGAMGFIVAAVLSLPAIARAEDQPHMQAALDAMKQAQEHLQQAEHDKGGHCRCRNNPPTHDTKHDKGKKDDMSDMKH